MFGTLTCISSTLKQNAGIGPPPTDMYYYYNFNSANRSGTSITNTGNGGTYPLTATNTATFDTSKQLEGDTCITPTSSYYYSYTNSGNHKMTDCTYSFWIAGCNTTSNTTDTVFSVSNSTAVTFYCRTGTTINMSYNGTALNGQTTCSSAYTTVGTYAHLCVTFVTNGSGCNVKAYVNGSLVNSGTATTAMTGYYTRLYLQRVVNGGGSMPINSSIDCVRYFDRVLSMNEILAIYNART